MGTVAIIVVLFIIVFVAWLLDRHRNKKLKESNRTRRCSECIHDKDYGFRKDCAHFNKCARRLNKPYFKSIYKW